MAKWQTLAAPNLRLTDIEVTTLNGQELRSGIWEEGTGAYYLWIDADESSFLAKWSELASQNLRLVDFDVYTANGQTLWAAIWRSGTDGYYLWANVSEANFLAKWSDLAGQNLRLIDMIAVPLDEAGGVTGALALGDAIVSLTGERIGTSEMTGRMSQPLGIAKASTATDHGVAATGRPFLPNPGGYGRRVRGRPSRQRNHLSSTGERTPSSEMTGRMIGRGGDNPSGAAGVGAGGGSATGGDALSAGSGKGGGAVSEAAIGSAQAGVGGGRATARFRPPR